MYSEIMRSMSRGNHSPNHSQKIPHSSAVGSRYGVSFGGLRPLSLTTSGDTSYIIQRDQLSAVSNVAIASQLLFLAI